MSSKQEQAYTNSHPLVEDTPEEDLLAAGGGGGNSGRFADSRPEIIRSGKTDPVPFVKASKRLSQKGPFECKMGVL